MPLEQFSRDRNMLSLFGDTSVTPAEFAVENEAAVEYEAKKFANAILICTKALREHPANATLYYLRANAYEDSGNRIAALQDYEKYIRLCPEKHNGHFRVAMCHHKAGDFPEALSHYDRAIQTYKSPDSITWKLIQDRTGSDQASNYYDIKREVILNNRAVVRGNLGDQQGAIADFTEAIKENPRYAKAYLGRAGMHMTLGNREKTIADAEKAATLGDDSAQQIIRIAGSDIW